MGGCLDENTLAALWSGHLSPDARRSAEEHLDACAACRDEIAALARKSAGATVEVGGQHRTQQSWVSTLPRETSESIDPESALAWGDLVDHYRVEHLLGRGGMGEVYLARDTQLRRRVALKMVSQTLLSSPRSVDRFLREARTTARVNHPNIVTIHGIGEHRGRPYLALEYVEGMTLRQWTLVRRSRPLHESLRVGLSIADALVEAHRHGVLHRDLKPENVLVGSDGRVRVVDFGLAETVESDDAPASTRTDIGPIVTGMAGTPRYMAPEQWLEQECSGATDVWALGVMLFELVSKGSFPFDAQGPMGELAVVVCNAEPAPLPREVDAPPALAELITHCLAREPAARPAAPEVASALRHLLESAHPLESAPRPVERRQWRWLFAPMAIAAGGAVALMTARADPLVGGGITAAVDSILTARVVPVATSSATAATPAASASASAAPKPVAHAAPPAPSAEAAPSASELPEPEPAPSNLLKKW